MVHALIEIHRLLAPDGILIDIHPLPTPMQFEVRKDDEVIFSRPELDFCDDRYRQAQSALDEVVRRGLFVAEDIRTFDFLIFASSASELRAHLEEVNAFEAEPEDPEFAERRRQLYSSLQEAMCSAGPGTRVATHEVATMSRLRSIP